MFTSEPQDQLYHIKSERRKRTPVSSNKGPTFLRRVIVCTGGPFTLTLYDGLQADTQPLAIITAPSTGAVFPFNYEVEQGLSYTLEGTPPGDNPCSVVILYRDQAPPHEGGEILEDMES